MGSHHKRNEGLKPIRRMAAKPKADKHRSKHLFEDDQSKAVFALQQTFLDLLANHFQTTLNDPAYGKKLQAVKGHFFRREYAKVFEDSDACIVYSVRYLPSRALSYAELFNREPILDLLYPPPAPRRPSEKCLHIPDKPLKKIVSVGAGVGSELCALHLLNQRQRLQLGSEDEDWKRVLDTAVELDVVDSADYGPFLNDLNNRLNASSRDNHNETQGRPLVEFNYHREDILKWSESPAFAGLLAETTLLTFMFVFNELFAVSKILTMRMIAAIAKNMAKGSHVLLIESAGELSQVKLDPNPTSYGSQVKFTEAELVEEERKGLMVYKFWDHLPGFERVLAEDRAWYRLHPNLKYPLEMENVGYFVRLYRKL